MLCALNDNILIAFVDFISSTVSSLDSLKLIGVSPSSSIVPAFYSPQGLSVQVLANSLWWCLLMVCPESRSQYWNGRTHRLPPWPRLPLASSSKEHMASGMDWLPSLFYPTLVDRQRDCPSGAAYKAYFFFEKLFGSRFPINLQHSKHFFLPQTFNSRT